MFLRSSVVKKAGKSYRYWKLVEIVRTDAGPRQHTAAWMWCCPTSKPLRSVLPVWDRAYSDNHIDIYYTI